MVRILQKNDPKLREIAKKVAIDDIGTKKIQGILADMKKALASQDDGVAIAAPQIGVLLRIFVVSHKMLEDVNQKEDMVFINPIITKLSKKKTSMEEGCLSVRWLYGDVKRSVKTSVQAYDEKGTRFSYNASDLMAQIFQHEIDHLEGILFTDTGKNIREIKP